MVATGKEAALADNRLRTGRKTKSGTSSGGCRSRRLKLETGLLGSRLVGLGVVADHLRRERGGG